MGHEKVFEHHLFEATQLCCIDNKLRFNNESNE